MRAYRSLLQNLVPGTALQPTHKDDRIPVLLIQRSIESSSPLNLSSPQHHTSDSTALHGWTLIIPQGWAMPFLPSLIHTGTRVGGQRERQTQTYEGGCAFFPRDYPFTDAYEEYADEREMDEEERWERRPPAKRVNYAKIGTRSPWRADWGVVLGLEEPPAVIIDEDEDEEDLVPAQRADEVMIDPDSEGAEASALPAGTDEEKDIKPWLLRGRDVPSILQNISTVFNPSAGLLDSVNQLRVKRGLDQLGGNLRAVELWAGALVRVRVRLCGRGNPEDLALIYSVDDDEAGRWNEAEVNRKQGLPALLGEGEDETEVSAVVVRRVSSLAESRVQLSNLPASSDNVIGYVTTGHYSLSRGEGHAIGAVPVHRLLELHQQAERSVCCHT